MNSEAPQEPRALEQPVSFVEVQEAWHEMMGPIPDTVGTSRWHRVSSVGARVGSLFGFSSESG